MVKNHINFWNFIYAGFVLILFLPIQAERISVSPVKSQIYSEFSTIPANPRGKEETRYFIRIAYKITLEDLQRKIDKVVLSVSDSVIQKNIINGNCTRRSNIPDGFHELYYIVSKSNKKRFVSNKLASIHFIINEDRTMVALWSFESKMGLGNLSMSIGFSKKILYSFFKCIPNTYYLGKQILKSEIVEKD